MKLRSAAMLLVVSGAVCAEADLDEQDYAKTADLFGKCAGVWRVVGSVERSEGKPAAAQETQGIERGALTVSAWAFGMRHHLLNPSLPLKTIGAFKARAESVAERETTALLAMLEAGKSDEVVSKAKACVDAQATQHVILEMIRDSFDLQQ